MLRQKGLVQAAPAPRACATSTPSSSARQSFPSGWTPAVKDCFGLHGHSTFGSVAKEKIGVGGKSATSVGLTTDLVHWLQTCFRLPHCLGCIAACGFSRPPPRRDTDYRLPPVIVLPLWLFVFVVVVVRMLRMDFNQKGSACAVVLLLYVLLYYMGRRHNSCSLYVVLVVLVLLEI